MIGSNVFLQYKVRHWTCHRHHRHACVKCYWLGKMFGWMYAFLLWFCLSDFCLCTINAGRVNQSKVTLTKTKNPTTSLVELIVLPKLWQSMWRGPFIISQDTNIQGKFTPNKLYKDNITHIVTLFCCNCVIVVIYALSNCKFSLKTMFVNTY